MLSTKKSTKYLRLAIQLLFLILMPGLFTMIFGQMRQIYTSIISGKINFNILVNTTLPLLILVFLTIIFGRFFCGYMCAFGTINDLLYKLSSRVFKIKFKVNRSVDSFLKLIKYAVLLFIIVGVWTFEISGLNSINPWEAFAQLIQFPPQLASVTALIVLMLIFVGALFIERFFCRYLCPLGAFLSILQVFRIVKIRKDKTGCINGCNACTRSCPMGINLDKVNRVDSLECIECMNCVGICPKGNAKLTIFGRVINQIIIIVVFVLAFLGLKGLAEKVIDFKMMMEDKDRGINLGEHMPKPDGKRRHRRDGEEQQRVQNVEVTQGKYKDGKYIGSAIGFKPGLTVEVTISGGKISKIEIVDHNETPSYAEIPFKIVPDEIIKKQSTNVDAVSGATRTSVGIMNAVAEALKQAEQK
ncbi:FMN-binding protein [Caloramator proteoclasticus]|uniref:4Fe-4S dicluster domain-containing protein n=1 Tax=Caloramator proteoclasticus DSM 10124 TaxID=1121262 RepID=A0A1M5B8N7_9CLOT|nr:4Fe-4S binding protein [Caloramator proteoclasticus]SHF38776.1 4Fe-4S dicluster domain-containing protein [Caloramator proteoclasticus DSM 10124]